MYLKWLKEVLFISPDRLVFEIYIHESYDKKPSELREYWSKITGFGSKIFKKIYFKKNKIHSLRKNKREGYNGVLRIKIRRSTDLNRRILGLVEGICIQSGVASKNEI